jgi:hypothetical protein
MKKLSWKTSAWMLLAALFLAPPAAAANRVASCQKRCEKDVKMCEDLCKKHAGTSTDKCVNACRDEARSCSEDCQNAKK